MKYFKADINTWGEKINFVDENNVLVGYDYSGQCCENFGWCIGEKISMNLKDALFDDSKTDTYIDEQLKGWTFDTEFFKEIQEEESYNDIRFAIFRLVKGDQERFLHLYNIHNGYYSHGFEFQQDDTTLQKGCL